jgi:hypothetical protein
MTKTPTPDIAESTHPLASLIGAWKDTEKLQTLVERVEEYRREVDAKEEKSEGQSKTTAQKSRN